MNERTWFKKPIIEFYRKEKEYDFRKLEPHQLGFNRDADIAFFEMYRGELRKELIRERKLHIKNKSNEFYLAFEKPSPRNISLMAAVLLPRLSLARR